MKRSCTVTGAFAIGCLKCLRAYLKVEITFYYQKGERFRRADRCHGPLVPKANSGSRDKITNCSGNYNLVRSSLQFDPACSLHGRAADTAVGCFTFTDVESCRHGDTQTGRVMGYRADASDGPSRTVKRSQKVLGSLAGLTPPEPLQFARYVIAQAEPRI